MVPPPDIQTARSFLAFIAGASDSLVIEPDTDVDNLVAWLAEYELGSLAHARFRYAYPALAERLQAAQFIAVAQNSLHWRNLQQIDEQFAEAGLSAVLLKGAALASTVYDAPEQRPMADVDIWLRAHEMRQGCALLSRLDFYVTEDADRPLALQLLSDGEIQFGSRTAASTLVELHFSPFEGWWLKRTAGIDLAALWQRKEPLAMWRAFYQLSVEDMILQIALHLAVGHQFGKQTLRSLVDIALTVRSRSVNWQLVADRASEWRVATAVWLVLLLTQQLLVTPALDQILELLRPAAWRRKQLLRFVSPESVLAGKVISDEKERYLFLLLLVDRPLDAGKLVARTVWPEEAWLAARYGGQFSHWQHLRRLVLEGEV